MIDSLCLCLFSLFHIFPFFPLSHLPHVPLLPFLLFPVSNFFHSPFSSLFVCFFFFPPFFFLFFPLYFSLQGTCGSTCTCRRRSSLPRSSVRFVQHCATIIFPCSFFPPSLFACTGASRGSAPPHWNGRCCPRAGWPQRPRLVPPRRPARRDARRRRRVQPRIRKSSFVTIFTTKKKTNKKKTVNCDRKVKDRDRMGNDVNSFLFFLSLSHIFLPPFPLLFLFFSFPPFFSFSAWWLWSWPRWCWPWWLGLKCAVAVLLIKKTQYLLGITFTESPSKRNEL